MEEIYEDKMPKTPSDYINFLRTEEGKAAFIDLRKAMKTLNPYKNRAILSVIVGILIAGGIYYWKRNFYGLLALIPAIIFVIIYTRRKNGLEPKQRRFDQSLISYIMGPGYNSSGRGISYSPSSFMRMLEDVDSVETIVYRSLGQYGNALRLRVTRVETRTVDGETKKSYTTTDEFGNVVRLPETSLLSGDWGRFYFEPKDFKIISRFLYRSGYGSDFSFTDSELDKMFKVSLSGYSYYADNYDAQLEWTRVITPYFESVIKALVAKYGQINFAIEDDHFFINAPGKASGHHTSQYGNLKKREYRRIWSSNSTATIKFGKTSPKSILPYLYRIYLNRIMDAMVIYFFCDHNDIEGEDLDEARYILNYVIDEYYNLDSQAMMDEYESIKEEYLND